MKIFQLLCMGLSICFSIHFNLDATPYGVRNASLQWVCIETTHGQRPPCLAPESSVFHYRGFQLEDLPLNVWVGCEVPDNPSTFKTTNCLKSFSGVTFTDRTPGNGIIVWGGLVHGEYWYSWD